MSRMAFACESISGHHVTGERDLNGGAGHLGAVPALLHVHVRCHPTVVEFYISENTPWVLFFQTKI